MRITDRKPRQALQLESILNAFFITETQLKIEVHDTVLFDNIAVYHEFDKYASFFFAPYRVYTTLSDDFRELWRNYISVNGENLYREYQALYSEYNPIENYSLYETGADGTKRGKMTNETTPTGSTTTTDTVTETGLDTVGDGSLTETREQTAGFNNRKDTTTTEFENSLSATFEDETKTGYNEAKEHFFKRSGNIGTMTPADMITKEQELRQNSLLSGFVKRFVFEHCFYVN